MTLMEMAKRLTPKQSHSIVIFINMARELIVRKQWASEEAGWKDTYEKHWEEAKILPWAELIGLIHHDAPNVRYVDGKAITV